MLFIMKNRRAMYEIYIKFVFLIFMLCNMIFDRKESQTSKEA
jgi:hypothetical protein